MTEPLLQNVIAIRSQALEVNPITCSEDSLFPQLVSEAYARHERVTVRAPHSARHAVHTSEQQPAFYLKGIGRDFRNGIHRVIRLRRCLDRIRRGEVEASVGIVKTLRGRQFQVIA